MDIPYHLRGTRHEQALRKPNIKITVEGAQGVGKSYVMERIAAALDVHGYFGVSKDDYDYVAWGESGTCSVLIEEKHA